ncbi:DNA-binding response regulator [Saccharobesus litoralis]|uniref:DNA-binding response regulator n=1 Tax=Saccharobesus litoralis TaxID=2172099 RepID=A0A2S0VPW4_9ALTE|nr:response regulator [Saccharobesus litoralis]AWB66239.1 DNA-binding response regulator [Saccharobesus litoralis]
MKALIVEDSRLAREGLARMLANHSEVEVIGTAANVAEALQIIQQTDVELLFLDIHMPEENGFDLLGQLAYQPKVIFTTAYSEYAIQSFEYNTIDYLLKPISKARLATAINKLLKAEPTASNDSQIASDVVVSDAVASEVEEKLSLDSKIFVKDGDECHLISLREIEYIESCKNYVRVFFGGHNAFIKKSLSQVESRLPARCFFRANRQYIINLNFVSQINENLTDGYDVKLQGGRLIDVSRRNASKMKELLSL